MTGGQVAISDDTGGITLGTVVATIGLDVESTGGDIAQAPGSTIASSGPTSLDASTNDVLLGNAGNDFAGTVDATGGQVALSDDTGGITLGTVVATTGLAVESTGGDITQAPGSTIASSGPTSLDAGTNDVMLGNAGNDFVGSVNLKAKDVVLNDSNDLVLGSVETKGTVVTTSGGVINPGTTTPVTEAPLINRPTVAQLPSPTAPLGDTKPQPSTSAAPATVNFGALSAQEAPPVEQDLRVSVFSEMTQDSLGLMSVRVASQRRLNGFTFGLPKATVEEIKRHQKLPSVTLLDGEPLPAWLRFDAANHEFVADEVPMDALPMTVILMVDGQQMVIKIASMEQ